MLNNNSNPIICTGALLLRLRKTLGTAASRTPEFVDIVVPSPSSSQLRSYRFLGSMVPLFLRVACEIEPSWL